MLHLNLKVQKELTKNNFLLLLKKTISKIFGIESYFLK